MSIKSAIRKYLYYLAHCAKEQNKNNIKSLFEYNKKAKICDLGVDDGIEFIEAVIRTRSNNLYGCDINFLQLKKASELGIITPKEPTDLNYSLPYNSNYFDVVYSAFTIEHILNIDNFVKEIYRILKPNGYAIISTENLSSWHNIFALILGYQAFSQIISRQIYGIGNPLSINRGEKIFQEAWSHIHILTYHGLKEIFEIYRFKAEKLLGAGYHPFPHSFSKVLSTIDARHSVYLTLKVRKVDVTK